MDEDLKEMIEGFVEDSREAFDSMEDDLIAMEESPDDPSIMNNLFRVMHTLKGTAGFMGLTEISSLSHKLESVFDLVRQGNMPMTAVLIDFLLPAIDQLKALVFSLVGERETVDVNETVRILEQIVASSSDAVLQGGGASGATPPPASTPPPKEPEPEPEEAPSVAPEPKGDVIDFDAIMAEFGQEPPAESVSEEVEIPSDGLPTAKTFSQEELVEAMAKYPPMPIIPEDMRSQISGELMQQFVQEAEEHLETIEESLLELEEQPSASEPIDAFFRAIHSIKGTASYVNLKLIETLSHRVENVFDLLRKGNLKYTKDIGDVVFKSIDILRTMVFYVKISDYSQVVEIAEVAMQLDSIISGDVPSPPVATKTAPATSTSSGDSDLEKLRVFLNGAKQQLEVLNLFRGEFDKGPLDEHSLITLHRSLKTLYGGASYCELIKLQQLISDYEELLLKILGGEEEQTDLIIQNKVKPAHDKVVAELDELKQDAAEQPVAAPPPPPPKTETPKPPPPKPETKATPPPPPPPPKREAPKVVAPPEEEVDSEPATRLPAVVSGKKDKKRISNEPPQKKEKEAATAGESKTMRVDASRLDRFMNLIGELIIARNAFKHLADSIDGTQNITDLTRDIKQIENNISRISDNLQDNLMDMRLVQVKTVFQRMPRIVRDIARKTNKKIQLQMVGEYTEVDKSIVEEIGDPLVHIIRNSCDHGVEAPDVRIAKGKPEQGTIVLKASHMGSFIAIDIIDDGKGVDPDIVKSIAVKKGVITQDESDRMTDEQAVNLIFAPGFSTAEAITDISGRGVGMDVVMNNIRNIQGTVEVKSKKGEGTQVRLKLPLTLAVIEALVVGVNNSQYAIPLDAIKETVQITESAIKKLKEKSALELRGEILGVTPLPELLQLPKVEQMRDEWAEEKFDRKLAIVVLQVNNREIGIAVDELFNQQEIVVKPLEDYLASIPGLKGSTIMGDGQIVLILEPNELMEMATG